MTTRGWTMSAAALAVAVGVYFALETLHPPQHDAATALPMLAADEMFAGTLDEAAGARAMADEQAGEPAGEVPAESEPAGDTVGEIPTEIVGTEAELQDLAIEASSPATATAAGPADPVESTDDLADDLADARPADETSQPDAESVAEAPAESSTEVPAATAEEGPATVADSDAAPVPASVDTSAPAVRPAVKQTAVEPTLSEWWHTGAPADAPGALELQYAGSVAGRPAIALLFSGEFGSSESADRNALVFDLQGRRIAGQWTIGSKPNVLEFSVPEAGYYTVMVSGALQDAAGTKLGKTLKGPVRVK